MQRPHRKRQHNFIDNAAAQELWQAGKIAGQRITRLPKLRTPTPLLVDKTDDPVTQPRLCVDPFGEFRGALVGPDNQHIAQVPAVKTQPPEQLTHTHPACHRGQSAARPKDAKKHGRRHPNAQDRRCHQDDKCAQ